MTRIYRICTTNPRRNVFLHIPLRTIQKQPVVTRHTRGNLRRDKWYRHQPYECNIVSAFIDSKQRKIQESDQMRARRAGLSIQPNCASFEKDAHVDVGPRNANLLAPAMHKRVLWRANFSLCIDSRVKHKLLLCRQLFTNLDTKNVFRLHDHWIQIDHKQFWTTSNFSLFKISSTCLKLNKKLNY